jgi:hypothetical protein
MSATVLAFPNRGPAAIHPVPPPECPEVIRFPQPHNRLARHDLAALVAVIVSARGEWRCEAEWDGDGQVSAIIVSGGAVDGVGVAFLICRSGHKLLLMDAQLADDWRMLGAFDSAEELAIALSRAME